MNVSVLSGPYFLMTDLHSQLMTLNDLRTLGGQACLRLGCFAVAWGITVRRDRRAPHTAMPTAAFESILGWSLTSRCSGNGILNESQSKRQVTSPLRKSANTLNDSWDDCSLAIENSLHPNSYLQAYGYWHLFYFHCTLEVLLISRDQGGKTSYYFHELIWTHKSNSYWLGNAQRFLFKCQIP